MQIPVRSFGRRIGGTRELVHARSKCDATIFVAGENLGGSQAGEIVVCTGQIRFALSRGAIGRVHGAIVDALGEASNRCAWTYADIAGYDCVTSVGDGRSRKDGKVGRRVQDTPGFGIARHYEGTNENKPTDELQAV